MAQKTRWPCCKAVALPASSTWVVPIQGLHGKGLASDYFIRWCSLDPVRNWNITLTLSADALFPAYGSPRVHRGWVCLNRLRAFSQARQSEVSSESRMALLNARSVVNKTVIINDFFSLRELDLLFITESWITTGDLSPFSELLTPKCFFFICLVNLVMGTLGFYF